MEISQLCSILEACMSPNQQQRAAAEQTLSQFQHARGQLVNLLRIAVEPTLTQGVRQVAAISFKNLVKQSWNPAEGPSPIQDEDKESVRDNLLESIIRAPPIVRVQLGECLKNIVYTDYPERWPTLLQVVLQNLATQEQDRIYGSLYVLRILARKYELKDSEDRAPLTDVISASFPSLLQLVKQLVATGSAAVEVAELLKLAFKTFWSAMYMTIPEILLQQEQFVGWMTCLHTLLVRPVPQEGQPEDVDARKSWPWWKTEKWALHITYRLFSRYGDPKLSTKGTHERLFSEMWQKQCSIQFLEAHMQIIARLTQGEYLSQRVVNLVLQYLSHAIGLSQTWKLVKPHVQTLLANCIFPLMCFSDEDAELWEEDPLEYIRKGYDIIEDLYSPKTAAMNFVHELCKLRTKGNLDIFMNLCIQVLNEYQTAQGGAGESSVQSARRVDGAFLAVGALNDVLKRKDPYKKQLEQMLLQYVVPAFESRHGHLRAKACWVGGQYADIPFRDGRGSGPTFKTLFACTVKALNDAELPVRVDAVAALRNLMDAYCEDHLDEIKPHIPNLLDQLFRLMAEVDNEDLVFTLETIVEKFGEEMAPYAVGLCTHLTRAFWRMQEPKDDEDEAAEEEGALAAFGCLRALSTVLESVSSLPHIFPALEPIVFPVLQRMCGQEGQDVFEEILEILSYFTYFAPEISQDMWSLWPQLYQAYNEWAFDYFENIIVPLDNFISRGTDVFLASQNPNYLNQAVQMAEKALTDGEASEGDVVSAPKLLEIILQNCRGRVDHCVGPFITLALARLGTAKRNNLKDQLVGVVANALYYNGPLSLSLLQQQNQLSAFFTTWFQMIFATRSGGRRKHFRRQHDKKVNVLGLLAVMTAPDAALVPHLQAAQSQLLAGCLKLLVDLKKQQVDFAAADSEDEQSDDDEDEDYVEEEEEEEEESKDNAADEAYLKRLNREAAKLAGKQHSESDSDDEWTDDEEDSTPLDDVNPFVAFADALRGLQSGYPGRFAALTANTDQGAQAALQGMMQLAEQQRQTGGKAPGSGHV